MAVDTDPFIVYLGYDSREGIASDVAAHSIQRLTKSPIKFRYLKHRKLRKAGWFKRPWFIEGGSGEFRDLIDDRPFSTEFSHTRFLVPALQKYKGWALFMDSDMIFTNDISKLFAKCDSTKAIMCVKHFHEIPKDGIKMDGRVQQNYYRKNWSSFVLWNCGHPANKDLTPEKINYMKGSDLHAFNWLEDDQIGALSFNYNYISGISPILSDKPSVIHYTEGGPWFSECKNVPYADWWDDERRNWEEAGSPDYDGELIDRSLETT